VTNEIRSPSSPLVAFEVRYQAYDDPKIWCVERSALRMMMKGKR
jgi:hypothetical protein